MHKQLIGFAILSCTLFGIPLVQAAPDNATSVGQSGSAASGESSPSSNSRRLLSASPERRSIFSQCWKERPGQLIEWHCAERPSPGVLDLGSVYVLQSKVDVLVLIGEAFNNPEALVDDLFDRWPKAKIRILNVGASCDIFRFNLKLSTLLNLPTKTTKEGEQYSSVFFANKEMVNQIRSECGTTDDVLYPGAGLRESEGTLKDIAAEHSAWQYKVQPVQSGLWRIGLYNLDVKMAVVPYLLTVNRSFSGAPGVDRFASRERYSWWVNLITTQDLLPLSLEGVVSGYRLNSLLKAIGSGSFQSKKQAPNEENERAVKPVELEPSVPDVPFLRP